MGQFYQVELFIKLKLRIISSIYMQKVKSTTNNLLPLGDWKQFVLGLTLATIFLGGGTFLGLQFLNTKAEEWGQNLRYYSELYPEPEKDKAKDSPPIATEDIQTNLDIYLGQFNHDPESHKLRIRKQLGIASSRAKTHLRSTKDFYVWSSLVLGIAQMASVVSASCLLHITRKGWDTSNSMVKGIFVTSAGTVAFCSSCIFLYEYEKNTANNASLYVYYVNLEDDIIAALATQSPLSASVSNPTAVKEGTPVRLKPIILNVQKKLNEANTLDIKFDLDRNFEIEDLLQQLSDSEE